MTNKTSRTLRAEYLAHLEAQAQDQQERARQRRAETAQKKKDRGIVTLTVEVRQGCRDLIDEMIRPALQTMNTLEQNNANTATFIRDVGAACETYFAATEADLVKQVLRAKRGGDGAGPEQAPPVGSTPPVRGTDR